MVSLLGISVVCHMDHRRIKLGTYFYLWFSSVIITTQTIHVWRVNWCPSVNELDVNLWMFECLTLNTLDIGVFCLYLVMWNWLRDRSSLNAEYFDILCVWFGDQLVPQLASRNCCCSTKNLCSLLGCSC